MSALRVILCSECPSRLRRESAPVPENIFPHLRKALQEKFPPVHIMGTGCMGVCPRGRLTCFVTRGRAVDGGTYLYIVPDDTERFYENLRIFMNQTP